jgi:putative DNA primase/helicase
MKKSRKHVDFIGAKFDARSDGVYVEYPDGKSNKIAPAIRYVGRGARPDGASVSAVIWFRDGRGRKQEIIVPIAEIDLHKTKFFERLLDLGYPAHGSSEALEGVRRYVLKAHSDPAVDFVLVDAGGWHGGNFVLGKKIISTSGSLRVRVIGPMAEMVGKFQQKGEMTEWQSNVAAKCKWSARLLFSLCAAFAAPLLEIACIEGGGFNITGKKGIGKTTWANLAGSVYGGGEEGYLEPWDMTDRAPDTLCLVHNDVLLCLDELDELDPDTTAGAQRLKFLVQRLSNSRKRGISYRASAQDIRLRTRNLFLGTSERSVPRFMRDGAVDTSGGQLVRFVDIPADPGTGFGILDDLPKMNGSRSRVDWDEFLRSINFTAERNYGVAGYAYLKKLVAERYRDEVGLRLFVEGKVERFMSAARDQAPQSVDRRILRRFAIVYAGGALALRYGILPKECNGVGRAVMACLKAALTVNPDARAEVARDPVLAVNKVVTFLRSDASHTIRLRAGGKVRSPDEFELAHALIQADADGHKRAMVKSSTIQRIFADAFPAAKQVLDHEGVLIKSHRGELSRQERVPGLRDVRENFYIFDYDKLLALAGRDKAKTTPTVPKPYESDVTVDQPMPAPTIKMVPRNRPPRIGEIGSST